MKNENTTATLPAEQIEETSETSQKPKKKNVTRRVLLGGGLGTLAVAGIGAGWAYNRYLAEHTQIDDTVAYEKSQQAKNNNSSSDSASSPSELTNVKVTSDGLSASEGSITITKSTEGSGNNAVVSFAAEIKLNAMTLLRGAFANNKFGQNIIDMPSNIAAQHNGIWAINGDYYGFRDTGIVIRNGVAYRDSGAREGLAFYQDGSVKLYDETGTNAQQLLNEGVWNTLSFGTQRLSAASIRLRSIPTSATTLSKATSRVPAWACSVRTTSYLSWSMGVPTGIRAELLCPNLPICSRNSDA